MLVPGTFTTGPLTFRAYFDTDTGYSKNLEWKNTSPSTTYVLQVYNESTGGRYNYRLNPTTGDGFTRVDGYVSAPRSDIFMRITGTVPYTPPQT